MFKRYYLKLIGIFLIGGGLALIVEHFLTWGYLEFEPLGHETYGLMLMIVGFALRRFAARRG